MFDKQKNVDRFSGFADTYESARPRVPMYPVRVICRYLGRNPETIVDLGCGTGLSSDIWRNVCGNIIGIEPGGDMLRIARQKEDSSLHFRQAFANDTGLPDECADVVVCSQSFHWMEPDSTLAEVNRILKKGGVFATIDCDWPPVTKWQAEYAYTKLNDQVRKMELEMPEIRESFLRYPKDRHLENIKKSGYFTYARELLFANTEPCTRERFENILFTQGSMQAILKKCPERLADEVAAFQAAVAEIFGDDPFDIEFAYRMRVGIK